MGRDFTLPTSFRASDANKYAACHPYKKGWQAAAYRASHLMIASTLMEYQLYLSFTG